MIKNVFCGLAISCCVPALLAKSANVDFFCKANDDKDLPSLILNLEWASRVLPGVPPEEWRYLQAESEAASNLQVDPTVSNPTELARRRWAQLENRPLYYVWRVKRALGRNRADLNNIITPPFPLFPESPDATRLNSAVDAMSSASEYRDELHSFLRRNDLAAVKIDLGNADFLLEFRAGQVQFFLNRYVKCKLHKLMDRVK